MTDCNEIVALLSDYLDRDLPPDTCCGIEAHLSACRQCENFAASLHRTVELCRRFRPDDRPGPLAAGDRQRLRTAFEKVLRSMRDSS